MAAFFGAQDPDRERSEELNRHGHAESDGGNSELERDCHQSGGEPQPDEKAKVRLTVRPKVGANECEKYDGATHEPEPASAGWADDRVQLSRHGRRELKDRHRGHGEHPAGDSLRLHGDDSIGRLSSYFLAFECLCAADSGRITT